MAYKPKDPIRLVDGDGNLSPLVYRQDMAAWLHNGWRVQDTDRLPGNDTPLIPRVQTPIPPGGLQSVSDAEKLKTAEDIKAYRQSRTVELQSHNWQKWKQLSTEYGLQKTDKDAEWETMIPAIVEYEIQRKSTISEG